MLKMIFCIKKAIFAVYILRLASNLIGINFFFTFLKAFEYVQFDSMAA